MQFDLLWWCWLVWVALNTHVDTIICRNIRCVKVRVNETCTPAKDVLSSWAFMIRVKIRSRKETQYRICSSNIISFYLCSLSDSWSDPVPTNNLNARAVCCSGYSGHIPSCLSWHQTGKKENEEKTKREEIQCGQVSASGWRDSINRKSILYLKHRWEGLSLSPYLEPV